MSTLHANGPGEAIKRLSLMIMHNGLDVELNLVMELICDTVDVIVHQNVFCQVVFLGFAIEKSLVLPPVFPWL